MIKRISILIITSILLLPTANAYAISGTDYQSLYDDALYYEPQSCTSSGTNSASVVTTLSGSDNAQQIFNFFTGQGLSYAQTIGVMTNLYEQSHFNPEQVQIPPGGSSQVPTVGLTLGWGLAQWTATNGVPPNPVVTAAKQYNITTPIYELVTQLNIIWAQMKNTSPSGSSDMLTGLEKTNDPTSASNNYFTYFEGGGATPNADSIATASDIPSVEAMVKGDYSTVVASASSSNNADGCVSGQTVSCNSSSSSSSDVSSLRQNIVCLAEQQYAIWSKAPLAFRANSFLDYSQNEYEEWCADFVSWVYHEANYPFTGGVNGWGLPGVSEIEALPQSNNKFVWHPASSNYTPQPGDIVIYEGPVGSGIGHTAIVVSVSGGTPTVIGGDEGPAPDGVYGYPNGGISTTPGNPPSESTVNEGTLLGSEPAPNTFQGYVSPASN
jgi:hypothetical protein